MNCKVAWVFALVLGVLGTSLVSAAEKGGSSSSAPARIAIGAAEAKSLAKEALVFGFASAEAYKAVWYGLSHRPTGW